jgi:carbon monoxide dehydrogenase subunit G
MMQIEGSYLISAPREQVWPLIFDPQALIGLIPGCQRIEQISAGEYRGKIQVGLAAVNGSYDTLIKILASQPPESCRFEGEISGPTGLVKGDATFTLMDSAGNSLLVYHAQAIVTGALAKLSPRFIEGAVHTCLKIGLGNLNRQVQQAAPSFE